ncbi:MAG TPA: acyl-CoA reductase [Polyangiaceae bacterium]
MAEPEQRGARVTRLLAAAARLSDASQPESQALRARLLETTGLSEAGIALGLARCLETRATPGELAALSSSTPPVARALVLLSGSVFVAALRAIAVGVAASEQVVVRASRRDPALAEALHALVPDLFQLVSELQPEPGDQLWVYGSNETLASVRASLPAGVWLHAHGHGLGAVVVEPRAGFQATTAARRIALDTALFDQRGCLSPRLVCVVGSAGAALELAQALGEQLARLEQELPLGPRGPEQLAEARRQRDAAAYAFELLDAGSGWISLGERVTFPPAPRCLHVVPVADPVAALQPFAAHLTCLGVDATPRVTERLGSAFGGVRLTELGEMQRPPLDGPVDRRTVAELV